MIAGACPRSEQWDTIASHFTNVTKLYLDSGFEEDWHDSRFPENWELDMLVVGSAGSEVVQTPIITEGRVRHLALALTTGLRFEGPTTEELVEQFLQDVDSGKEETDYVVVPRRGVRVPIISTPLLATSWMERTYAGADEEAEGSPER